ncbi:MAG: LPS export ABC transporter protein LptC [Sphingobacteriales bacterium]|jgi:LPS export ABC transporter protein LptC
MIKHKILRTILSLGMVLSFFFTSCETDIQQVRGIERDLSMPVETSKDIELIYSDSAKVKARLLSPILKYFKIAKPYYEMPDGLTLYFFQDSMKLESTLTANYGVMYDQQGITEVKDNVVVVNKKGETMNTDRLIWNERTNKIYTDKFVKITTADEILYGKGFEANQNFTEYRIFNITGIISVKENAKNN